MFKYIGIILAANYMFKRPYYGSILASMHEYAHQKDWHIRFIRIFDDFSNPALFNELIHPHEISGVILLGLDQVLDTPEDYALVEQIVQRVGRVVCVEWEWRGIPSIQFDRQNAAYQAAQHLLLSGRKAVAYIGPNDKRVQGYQQALWEQGSTSDDCRIHFAIDSRHERCEQLIQYGVMVDARREIGFHAIETLVQSSAQKRLDLCCDDPYPADYPRIQHYLTQPRDIIGKNLP